MTSKSESVQVISNKVHIPLGWAASIVFTIAGVLFNAGMGYSKFNELEHKVQVGVQKRQQDEKGRQEQQLKIQKLDLTLGSMDKRLESIDRKLDRMERK